MEQKTNSQETETPTRTFNPFEKFNFQKFKNDVDTKYEASRDKIKQQYDTMIEEYNKNCKHEMAPELKLFLITTLSMSAHTHTPVDT